MKILIISYYFYPENTPRAFRAFELVREFIRLGHSVKIILPNKNIERVRSLGLDVDFVNFKKRPNNISRLNISLRNKNTFYGFLKKISRCIAPNGIETIFYFIPLFNELVKLKDKFDSIISIAMPIDTHIACALAFKLNRNFSDAIKIADYGDPLTGNPALPKCINFFFMDKFITSSFDYCIVPTVEAQIALSKISRLKNVKIIPQGFNFDDIKLSKYNPNSIVSFAYAGNFYTTIRNPINFFKYLINLSDKGRDFKFFLYTDTFNNENMEIVDEISKKLKEKLIIKHLVDRKELILNLSSMDFLINVNNISKTQSPSKLIDYYLTNRPIFSLNQNYFDEHLFENYLNFRFDYSNTKEINLSDYDIKSVVNSFIKLILNETL